MKAYLNSSDWAVKVQKGWDPPSRRSTHHFWVLCPRIHMQTHCICVNLPAPSIRDKNQTHFSLKERGNTENQGR